jgi:hypothetical protein
MWFSTFVIFGALCVSMALMEAWLLVATLAISKARPRPRCLLQSSRAAWRQRSAFSAQRG